MPNRFLRPRAPRPSSLIALAVAIVLLALPCAARAEDETEKSLEKIRGIPDRFGISVGAYAVRFSTEAALGPANAERRAKVDLEDVLGLARDQTNLRADGYFRFNRRHSLELGWVSMDRVAAKTIDEEFEYGDYIFGIGAQVESRFRTDWMHLVYDYSFVNRGRVNVGVTAGLSAFAFDLALAGSGNVQTPEGPVEGEILEAEKLRAPVPLIGLHLDYTIRRRLFLRTSIEYLDVGTGGWDARVREVKLSMDYFVSSHVGFGLGYDAMNMRYIDEDDPRFEVNFNYSGILAYASFRF